MLFAVEEKKKGGCFPSVATLKFENGRSITMSELQIGDKVQTGRT